MSGQSDLPIWRRKTTSKTSSIKIKNSAQKRKKCLDKQLEIENLSPFIIGLDNLPELPSNASFVEYLRWMRELKIEDSEQNKAENNATKLHLLQLAQDFNYANDSKYLKRANQKIKRIVSLKQGQEIEVTCPWRIRVGGHRGPESILLPAFDALGIPFIPSSTLRGIARTQAIREVMKNNPNLSYQKAEQHETIIAHFGSLETKDKSKREGKVTFLDAYPVADDNKDDNDDKSQSGGLSLDIANNVWKWGENNLPDYQPNPNLFLSLKKPTFLIGIIPNHHGNREQLNRVEEWLLKGLASGVGSQINSGYGCLTKSGNYEVDENNQKILLELDFTLKGQLINSNKSYNSLYKPYKINNNQIERGKKKIPKVSENTNSEVRPIAFKSMLRYWFRVIALGVLPQIRVKELEAFIFGGIEPKHQGLIQVQIHDSDDGNPPTQDNCGTQSGKLIILASPELSSENYPLLTDFIKALTWLMFHLGGVGLGARRPLHQRPTNPYWRGSDLKFESQDELWEMAETIEQFKKRFHSMLKIFYKKLDEIQGNYIQFMKKLKPKNEYTDYTINPQFPRKVERPKNCSWVDAIDKDCRILITQNSRSNSENNYRKSNTLSKLHSDSLNQYDLNDQDKTKTLNDQNKNRFLCGEDGIASPVIITQTAHYEIITIFDADTKYFIDYGKNNKKVLLKNPRNQYFKELQVHSKILYVIHPIR